MKAIILKAAAVLAVVCASFAFTTKGPLQVVACNVSINICQLQPGTFQEGTGIHFDQATFNTASDNKVGCIANCNHKLDVAPQGT